jgi:Raf kinase inhibitor-like YbhB/YbcL family protein
MNMPLLTDFKLSSPVFDYEQVIPVKYTCKGQNISPPLEIRATPENALSLALILHDPDAPSGDFLHWTMWNIDPGIFRISENSVPKGADQGLNNFGNISYGGPCPPSGTHRYVFDLYALNIILNLKSGCSLPDLERAMQDHIIDRTKLIGLVSA